MCGTHARGFAYRNPINEDGEIAQQAHYFYYNQVGIPREKTDIHGNLLWYGEYTDWGHLKEETKVTQTTHQLFHLQNQYADRETGLHYNFFRYYEHDAVRFVNQDPIGLLGGENLYQFAPSVQAWVDPAGLAASNSRQLGRALTGKTSWTGRQAHHLIPVEVFNNSKLLQRLSSNKLFFLNGKSNGIMLP